MTFLAILFVLAFSTLLFRRRSLRKAKEAKALQDQKYFRKFETWVTPENYKWQGNSLVHLPTGEKIPSKDGTNRWGLYGDDNYYYLGPDGLDAIITKEESSYISSRIRHIYYGLKEQYNQIRKEQLRKKFFGSA